MEPVVVSYFPGAGGFRFIHYLLGESFDQNPQSNYHQVHRVNDHLIHHDPADQYRYPLNNGTAADHLEPIAYTHAMNSDIIKRVYPGRRIVKIKSNLADSLIRYWNVEGIQHHQQDIQSIGLKRVLNKVMLFHWQYYFTTRIDWSADQLVDLESDTDEFSVFMRDQLQQTRSSDAYQYLKNWQFTTGIDMDFNCYLKPTDTINTSI
jgi:hypothetical protein